MSYNIGDRVLITYKLDAIVKGTVVDKTRDSFDYILRVDEIIDQSARNLTWIDESIGNDLYFGFSKNGYYQSIKIPEKPKTKKLWLSGMLNDYRALQKCYAIVKDGVTFESFVETLGCDKMLLLYSKQDTLFAINTRYLLELNPAKDPKE